MTRAAQRGHVLLLLTMILLAMSAIGLRIVSRMSVDLDDRPAEEVRLQALWLARSAVDAGVRGSRAVPTPVGPAQVRVVQVGLQVTAQVELEGAVAVVSSGPWQERYTPAATP